MSTTTIRPSTIADVEAMSGIYAWHVRHGSATFETEAPDGAEMARRRAVVLEHGLPWIVAEGDGAVVGFAYAGPFRPRAAYRFTVEDSVYLEPAVAGRGLGRLLLAELVARCEDAGARQMLAVIGDSTNAASIGLHRASGFEPVGTMRNVGWKFGRWLDVVIMQKTLGCGATVAGT